MATENHKKLAQFLKTVHSSLRQSSWKLGTEKAWAAHCGNVQVLKEYAECMQKLATTHWEVNCADDSSRAISRIKWTVDFCYHYFNNNTYNQYGNKDFGIAKKINLTIDIKEHFQKPYMLLDIGSCYNPFQDHDFFNVFAIDLYPANDTVLQCDFLNVKIESKNVIKENIVMEIGENSFDIVTFCFVLEYIPSSELRVEACKRAYKVLRPGGLMMITTPDSKHVGANGKIMKCWRYTMAQIGFCRIKYEKLPHMHCMAFRKSLHLGIAQRWASLHEQENKELSLHIPQDYQTYEDFDKKLQHVSIEDENYIRDFTNMPFCDIFLEND